MQIELRGFKGVAAFFGRADRDALQELEITDGVQIADGVRRDRSLLAYGLLDVLRQTKVRHAALKIKRHSGCSLYSCDLTGDVRPIGRASLGIMIFENYEQTVCTNLALSTLELG